MTLVDFDARGLFRAIEEKRTKDLISLRRLGQQLDIRPSTFTRLSKDEKICIETFAVLIHWLQLPAEMFLFKHPESTDGEPVMERIYGVLTNDKDLRESDVEGLMQIITAAYNHTKRMSETISDLLEQLEDEKYDANHRD